MNAGADARKRGRIALCGGLLWIPPILLAYLCSLFDREIAFLFGAIGGCALLRFAQLFNLSSALEVEADAAEIKEIADAYYASFYSNEVQPMTDSEHAELVAHIEKKQA